MQQVVFQMEKKWLLGSLSPYYMQKNSLQAWVTAFASMKYMQNTEVSFTW